MLHHGENLAVLIFSLDSCLQVRVQSDPAGRLVISGEPEHPDNPWGVTPFKKVLTLLHSIRTIYLRYASSIFNKIYIIVETCLSQLTARSF